MSLCVSIRAAQKLSRKRKKNQETEVVKGRKPAAAPAVAPSAMLLTSFQSVLAANPPAEPPSLHRPATRLMGTNKVRKVLFIFLPTIGEVSQSTLCTCKTCIASYKTIL